MMRPQISSGSGTRNSRSGFPSKWSIHRSGKIVEPLLEFIESKELDIKKGDMVTGHPAEIQGPQVVAQHHAQQYHPLYREGTSQA